jgi:Coenzyme PQQ synthesis protein D (PqqD)
MRRHRGIFGEASEASSIPATGKQVPLITCFATVAYQPLKRNTRVPCIGLSRFCPSHVVVGLHREMADCLFVSAFRTNRELGRASRVRDDRDTIVAPAPRMFVRSGSRGTHAHGVEGLRPRRRSARRLRFPVAKRRLSRVYLLKPTAVSASISESLPVARPSVVWVNLPDGAVLFLPETEVYYGMNTVAAAVWELLPQSADSLDKLCSLILERFPDADLEQIRADTIALLEDLERAGLTEAAGAQSAD